MTPEQLEKETEALRPAKNRLLKELGYDPDTLPKDTHIVFTTSPFGSNFIEVDEGKDEADRHYLGDFTDRQHAALRDLIEQGRSTPMHYDPQDHADFNGDQP